MKSKSPWIPVRAPSRTLAVALLLGLMLASHAAPAGPWTEPKGMIYAKLWAQGSLPTQHYWSANGKVLRDSADRDYQDATFGVYVEYGVFEWLTLAADAAFWRIEVGGAADPDRNFSFFFPGHFGLSARTRLLDCAAALSLHTGLKIPFGFDEDPEPHAYGDGRFQGDFLLLGGFRWLDGWTSASLGLSLIDEKPSNRLVAHLETGYRFFWWLAPALALRYGHSLAANAPTENPFDDLPLTQDSLVLELRVGAELGGGFGLDVWYRRVLWGKQVFDNNVIGGGLSYYHRLLE